MDPPGNDGVFSDDGRRALMPDEDSDDDGEDAEEESVHLDFSSLGCCPSCSESEDDAHAVDNRFDLRWQLGEDPDVLFGFDCSRYPPVFVQQQEMQAEHTTPRKMAAAAADGDLPQNVCGRGMPCLYTLNVRVWSCR